MVYYFTRVFKGLCILSCRKLLNCGRRSILGFAIRVKSVKSVALSLLLIMLFSLNGCSQEKANAIDLDNHSIEAYKPDKIDSDDTDEMQNYVGSWYCQDELYFVLHKDFSCEIKGKEEPCIWEIVDDRIYVTDAAGDTQMNTIIGGSDNIKNDILVIERFNQSQNDFVFVRKKDSHEELNNSHNLKSAFEYDSVINYLGTSTQKFIDLLKEDGFDYDYGVKWSENTNTTIDGGAVIVYDRGIWTDKILQIDSSEGIISEIGIFDSNCFDDYPFSFYSILPGMPVKTVIDILHENSYVFVSINDSDYDNSQKAVYTLGGRYFFEFTIDSDEPDKPYGSIDETDIKLDGTVCDININGKIPKQFDELADYVGEFCGGHGHQLIEEVCKESYFKILQSYNYDYSENGYETYILGATDFQTMRIDVAPGAGDWPYVTYIEISAPCPYSLYGLYLGMNKDEALLLLKDVGFAVNYEDEYLSDSGNVGSCIVYEVDSYTVLYVYFNGNIVCSISCSDLYPGTNHDRIDSTE